MATTVEIQGFAEARAVLHGLPDKFQVQTVRNIFKKAAKPLIDDAKNRLLAHDPNYARLAAAIGFIPVSTRDLIVLVGVRAKGKYKDIGFIGHWVEYGVSGIKTTTSRNLSKEQDASYRFYVSRVPKGGRYRNDIPPQPFMRPAIDAKMATMTNEVGASFQKHLYRETEKAIRKAGGFNATAYAKAKGR